MQDFNNEKMTPKTYIIRSWLYGPGIIQRRWKDPDGVECYLASFPGWGRRFVRRSHFDAQAAPFFDN